MELIERPAGLKRFTYPGSITAATEAAQKLYPGAKISNAVKRDGIWSLWLVYAN